MKTFSQWLVTQNNDEAAITPEQRVDLQARFNAENPAPATMTDDVQAAIQGERRRLTEIDAIVGAAGVATPAVATLRARAVAGEVTIEALSAGLLSELRAARPVVSGAARPTSQIDHRTLEAALLLHANAEAIAVKAFDDRTLAVARRLPHAHLMDLARVALRLDQQDPDAFSNRDQMVRAAFSTVSLPLALENALNKSLLAPYLEAPRTFQAIANKRFVTDFRQASALRVGVTGNLEQLAENGEIAHGSMGEERITFQLATYAKMISITRQMVVNDDIGFIAAIPADLARAAARKEADLFWSAVMDNADSFFSSGHGNLLEGSGSALSVTALGSAITSMRSQRDGQNSDLDIIPKTLAVPPALEQIARMILNSSLIQAEEGEPTGNPLLDAVKLIVEPRLGNTARFTNASATCWFLFGSPADVPVIIAYLDGRDRPTVERADTDFNTLGVKFRTYFDIGVSLGDYRAAVRADGA